MVLAVMLVVGTPQAQWPKVAFLVIPGLAGWSVLEYLVHWFISHGVQPFRRWHAEHRARPTALICSPTIVAAVILAAFLFLSAWLIGDARSGCALTLGVLRRYIAYATTHHAIHHWHAKSAWLRRRQRWHFMDHNAQRPSCYCVTSGIWYAAFRSTWSDRKSTADKAS